MSHLVIACEADMEHGLTYTKDLALEEGRNKKLAISFPSEAMCSIFIKNLFNTFVDEEVPTDNGLRITLNVPGVDEEDCDE